MLSRLRLSHFRSHRAVDLAFDGRPVAIFGPNGAGKTNLIEAVSMLSPGRGLRGAASEELARTPERLGWKIAGEIDAEREVATWGEGAGRRVEIDGKPAPQAGLAGVIRLIWLTPAMDRLWTEGPAERRRFLDRLALSLFAGHAEVAQGYDRALRERNRLIRDDIRDGSWLGGLEEQMGAHGAGLRANRRAALAALAEADGGGGFPRAELTLETEGPDGAADLAEALAAGRARDFAAGRTLVGPHRDELRAVYAAKGMPARLCSTGEQKALLIQVMLANAEAVAARVGRPPVLLDEVAAHLDEGRRGALYAAILDLGAQAFLTGTGPELFEGLRGRADFRAVSEAGGESRVIEA